MAHSDEEDAFLYGSDNEDDQKSQQPVTKKVKFADEVETSEKQTTPETNKNNNKNNNDDDGEEEEEEYLDEEDESDSDDDIDIIIGDTQPTPSKTTTSTSIPSDTLSELNDTDASSSDKKPQQQRTTVTSSNIDVDKVPEYQDKPLTQLDIELLKLKPWRAPGVDVSDYFNFGFDEFTWIYYCHKQDKLRGEFNPSKVMESIMKGTGESNDAKPGVAGMPPFMANMPMPPPSFMANMPMPPMGMPMPPPGFNGQFPQPYSMPPNPNQ